MKTSNIRRFATLALVTALAASCGTPMDKAAPEAFLRGYESTTEGVALGLELGRWERRIFASYRDAPASGFGFAAGMMAEGEAFELEIFDAQLGVQAGLFTGRFLRGGELIQGTWKDSSGKETPVELAVRRSGMDDILLIKHAKERAYEEYTMEEPCTFSSFSIEPGESDPDFRAWWRGRFSDSKPLADAVVAAQDEFYSNFEAYAKELLVQVPEAQVNPWYMDSWQLFVYRTDRLAVTAMHLEAYSGGAHGNHATSFAVTDIADRRVLGPDDFFAPGWKEAIVPILTERARLIFKPEEGKGLSQAGLFNDFLPPSEDFFLSSGGIGFHYDPYEVGPYSTGEFWIFIPWAEARPLMNPEALARYGL